MTEHKLPKNNHKIDMDKLRKAADRINEIENAGPKLFKERFNGHRDISFTFPHWALINEMLLILDEHTIRLHQLEQRIKELEGKL